MTAWPLLGHGSRKARRDGWCELCRSLVSRGQRITRLPGYGWVHCACVVAANRRHAEDPYASSILTGARS